MTEEDRTEQFHIEIDTFGHEDVTLHSTAKALMTGLHSSFQSYRVWDEWGRRITYNPKHGGSITIHDGPRPATELPTGEQKGADQSPAYAEAAGSPERNGTTSSTISAPSTPSTKQP